MERLSMAEKKFLVIATTFFLLGFYLLPYLK